VTKKDYERIARAIAGQHSEIARDDERVWESAYKIGVCDAARALADALAEDNPRFDRERFLRACGVAS